MDDMKARIAKQVERVDMASTRMTIRKPFLAAVWSRLDRTVLSHPDGSAATDGHKAWFSVEHCEALTDAQLLTLCMHEASHVALLHPWRREHREPKKFNLAADYVIDTPLIAEKYDQHESWVMPPNWIEPEMSTEDVYSMLPDQKPPPNQGQQGDGSPSDGQQGQGQPSDGQQGQQGQSKDKSKGQGSSMLEDGQQGPTDDEGYNNCVKDGGDVGDAPDDSRKMDTEAAVMSAAKMAKASGDKSALVDFILGGGTKPSISWTEALRSVMFAADRTDYSTARVNRRFVHSGLHMPSLYAEAMGGLVVAVDTSISMSQEELQQAASEITAIFEDCNPEWVEFVPCSREVGKTHRFERGEQVKLHAQGRGGTRFKPVFDYIDGMQERVAALVYFTDLEGNLRELQHPDYPVIWAMTGTRKIKVPFGEVLKVQI